MEKLISAVKELVGDEYNREAEKFGKTNNSDHESYAIILEELHEAFDEVTNTGRCADSFWNCVKSKTATDKDKLEALERIAFYAQLAACEFIQVAAMAYKATLTIEGRSE